MRTIDLPVYGQNAQIKGTDYEGQVEVVVTQVDGLKLLYTLREKMGREDFKEFVSAVCQSYAVGEMLSENKI